MTAQDVFKKADLIQTLIIKRTAESVAVAVRVAATLVVNTLAIITSAKTKRVTIRKVTTVLRASILNRGVTVQIAGRVNIASLNLVAVFPVVPDN